jgi:hypothetical protein
MDSVALSGWASSSAIIEGPTVNWKLRSRPRHEGRRRGIPKFPRFLILVLIMLRFDSQGASPEGAFLHEGKKDGNENQDVNG